VIRLAIAAPSAVVRAGLKSLAASSNDMEVVGAFATLDDAAAAAPDVILTTITPEEAIELAAIVLLADEREPAWTPEAFRSGVRAVLPGDASPTEILAAIGAAAAGLAVIEPSGLNTLLSRAGRSQAAGPHSLTARELEVLRMMAEGAANKTIAWRLDISEHTVKFHVASVMAKLGAASRTEAVTTGIRQGLILI
jgi:DNA-binding NarL/FixJ family response regulator